MDRYRKKGTPYTGLIMENNMSAMWKKKRDLKNNLGSTTKKLPRNYQETIKTTAEIIKEIMRENPVVSAAHIAVKVGISVNGVQYHIKKMKASGEIERIGSDRGGYWKVND